MVSVHNERPVCFCECDDCPAGYPIAFAPLDVRFPPTFCKFCSTRFNFDESDIHPPQNKGYGKGDIGKGKYGKGDKGKGKGKDQRNRSSSPDGKHKPYDAYPMQHQAKPNKHVPDFDSTMIWLATLGLQPEVLLKIARAAQSSQGEAPDKTSMQLTEVQKLKAECRQAESADRITQC